MQSASVKSNHSAIVQSDIYQNSFDLTPVFIIDKELKLVASMNCAPVYSHSNPHLQSQSHPSAHLRPMATFSNPTSASNSCTHNHYFSLPSPIPFMHRTNGLLTPSSPFSDANLGLLRTKRTYFPPNSEMIIRHENQFSPAPSVINNTDNATVYLPNGFSPYMTSSSAYSFPTTSTGPAAQLPLAWPKLFDVGFDSKAQPTSLPFDHELEVAVGLGSAGTAPLPPPATPAVISEKAPAVMAPAMVVVPTPTLPITSALESQQITPTAFYSSSPSQSVNDLVLILSVIDNNERIKETVPVPSDSKPLWFIDLVKDLWELIKGRLNRELTNPTAVDHYNRFATAFTLKQVKRVKKVNPPRTMPKNSDQEAGSSSSKVKYVYSYCMWIDINYDCLKLLIDFKTFNWKGAPLAVFTQQWRDADLRDRVLPISQFQLTNKSEPLRWVWGGWDWIRNIENPTVFDPQFCANRQQFDYEIIRESHAPIYAKIKDKYHVSAEILLWEWGCDHSIKNNAIQMNQMMAKELGVKNNFLPMRVIYCCQACYKGWCTPGALESLKSLAGKKRKSNQDLESPSNNSSPASSTLSSADNSPSSSISSSVSSNSVLSDPSETEHKCDNGEQILCTSNGKRERLSAKLMAKSALLCFRKDMQNAIKAVGNCDQIDAGEKNSMNLNCEFSDWHNPRLHIHTC
jgi:hypothetical protein